MEQYLSELIDAALTDPPGTAKTVLDHNTLPVFITILNSFDALLSSRELVCELIIALAEDKVMKSVLHDDDEVLAAFSATCTEECQRIATPWADVFMEWTQSSPPSTPPPMYNFRLFALTCRVIGKLGLVLHDGIVNYAAIVEQFHHTLSVITWCNVAKRRVQESHKEKRMFGPQDDEVSESSVSPPPDIDDSSAYDALFDLCDAMRGLTEVPGNRAHMAAAANGEFLLYMTATIVEIVSDGCKVPILPQPDASVASEWRRKSLLVVQLNALTVLKQLANERDSQAVLMSVSKTGTRTRKDDDSPVSSHTSVTLLKGFLPTAMRLLRMNTPNVSGSAVSISGDPARSFHQQVQIAPVDASTAADQVRLLDTVLSIIKRLAAVAEHRPVLLSNSIGLIATFARLIKEFTLLNSGKGAWVTSAADGGSGGDVADQTNGCNHMDQARIINAICNVTAILALDTTYMLQLAEPRNGLIQAFVDLLRLYDKKFKHDLMAEEYTGGSESFYSSKPNSFYSNHNRSYTSVSSSSRHSSFYGGKDKSEHGMGAKKISNLDCALFESLGVEQIVELGSDDDSEISYKACLSASSDVETPGSGDFSIDAHGVVDPLLDKLSSMMPKKPIHGDKKRAATTAPPSKIRRTLSSVIIRSLVTDGWIPVEEDSVNCICETLALVSTALTYEYTASTYQASVVGTMLRLLCRPQQEPKRNALIVVNNILQQLDSYGNDEVAADALIGTMPDDIETPYKSVSEAVDALFFAPKINPEYDLVRVIRTVLAEGNEEVVCAACGVLQTLALVDPAAMEVLTRIKGETGWGFDVTSTTNVETTKDVVEGYRRPQVVSASPVPMKSRKDNVSRLSAETGGSESLHVPLTPQPPGSRNVPETTMSVLSTKAEKSWDPAKTGGRRSLHYFKFEVIPEDPEADEAHLRSTSAPPPKVEGRVREREGDVEVAQRGDMQFELAEEPAVLPASSPDVHVEGEGSKVGSSIELSTSQEKSSFSLPNKDGAAAVYYGSAGTVLKSKQQFRNTSKPKSFLRTIRIALQRAAAQSATVTAAALCEIVWHLVEHLLNAVRLARADYTVLPAMLACLENCTLSSNNKLTICECLSVLVVQSCKESSVSSVSRSTVTEHNSRRNTPSATPRTPKGGTAFPPSPEAATSVTQAVEAATQQRGGINSTNCDCPPSPPSTPHQDAMPPAPPDSIPPLPNANSQEQLTSPSVKHSYLTSSSLGLVESMEKIILGGTTSFCSDNMHMSDNSADIVPPVRNVERSYVRCSAIMVLRNLAHVTRTPSVLEAVSKICRAVTTEPNERARVVAAAKDTIASFH